MMKLFRPVLSTLRKEFARRMSSGSGELVKISVNDDSGFATVTMAKPPVNSLNLELLSSLHSALTDLEKNRCKGMILTSSSPTVFSAGLDIMEMYKPDLDRAKKFWMTLQDVWMKLYLSPFPSVAAINGHSPAGGCLLALCCEYRIMVGPKFGIGLNETQLGIIAPPWFMESMKNVLGTRQAELALTTGKLFPAPEALKVGLIDEMVSSKDEALQKAEDFLDAQSNLPPMARSVTKIRFRQPTVEWLVKNREEDVKMFLGFVTQPKVQQGLELYMASLKNK